MKKITFKIQRKIIRAFLFCFLSVFVFAILGFQVHREIGYRLRVVEVADDLVNNILEVRRFEKNFFLYKQRSSLEEALSYSSRVEKLYLRHEEDIQRLTKEGKRDPFLKTLARYNETLSGIQTRMSEPAPGGERSYVTGPEESLRIIGQELLDMAAGWAKEERSKIDALFRRALYLFVISMGFFAGMAILVTNYISGLFTGPLIRMQHAMEKIAEGDFTPIPEEQSPSDEFAPLFRAFNRMSHELEERQEQLVQARKISAIGTFTSGIAHELNNPVNNIVLTAEAFKEDFDDLGREEALGMIQDIIAQSERASEIIKNLLDFSRSERPEMVTVSIASVIRDTLKLVRNQLLLSGVEEQTDLPDDLPPVCGDYKSLQQVFLNLFINAVQAMPTGGILGARARLSDDGEWVKVEVRDTGMGIDHDDIPHIFDPFFTTKEVGKGTGLGLSVTYGILQKHGGAIEAHSKSGEGAVFIITLPARPEECSLLPNGEFDAHSRS
jgi:two-component system, NtrC family, sensor kinase